MNKLLQRQIEKYLGYGDSPPESLEPLLNAISDAYDSFDADRRLIERALDVSSEELTEANRQLRQEVIERRKAEERMSRLSHLKEELLAPIAIGEKLKHITDTLIQIFEADFARIWIIKPGDLCDSGCVHAQTKDEPHICRHRDRCLHLMASSGRYTHIDGNVHRRVPFDCYKIGCVASGTDNKFITNDVTNEPRVHDHQWAKKLGLVSFAGYRLISTEGDAVGILAMFSKNIISANDDTMLEAVANTISQVIQTTTAEEQLRKTEEKYRTQFEGALDAIFVADAETGILIDCNAAATRLVGRSKSELIGQSHQILHPSDRNDGQFSKTFKQHLTDKRGQTVETQVITKTGDTKDVAIKATLLEIGGRKILQGIFRDITESKKAEAAMREINEKLANSNRQLQEFIFIASHDLREPARKITAFGEILTEALTGKLEDDVQENFDFMIEGAERMRELVESLLAYSKVVSKQAVFRNVDLKLVLEHLKIAELSSCMEETRGKLAIPNLMPTVLCDPTQISILLEHLIANGFKYHRKDVRPVVTVRSSDQDKGMVRIEVEDNGIGIKSEQCANVFGMFRRLHGQEYKGTGMGLALCRKIVEKHSGEIGVESTYGQGSTFWFTLPLSRTRQNKRMRAVAGSRLIPRAT